MLNRRLLITVPVLLLIIFAVPSWGAAFRNRKISDQKFIDMFKKKDTR